MLIDHTRRQPTQHVPKYSARVLGGKHIRRQHIHPCHPEEWREPVPPHVLEPHAPGLKGSHRLRHASGNLPAWALCSGSEAAGMRVTLVCMPCGDRPIVDRDVASFITGGRGRPRHGRWPVERNRRIGSGPDVCSCLSVPRAETLTDKRGNGHAGEHLTHAFRSQARRAISHIPPDFVINQIDHSGAMV